MKLFRFWCQMVIPLVYDDSLSYYEILCKVVRYINELIAQDKVFVGEIDKLKKELKEVQEWIDSFSTDKIDALVKSEIEKYIGTMIIVEITDSGYIVYNIPEAWKDITFNTVGIDISIPNEKYGTLVLSY